MPPSVLAEVLPSAHQLLARALSPGHLAIDATMGNGHDTLHLAQHVGPEGMVIAFDIQPEAVTQTRQRLLAASCAEQVHLLLRGHEALEATVGRVLAEAGWPAYSLATAICFNLGYLPGGDKRCITRPDTTLAALAAATRCLAPKGVITIVTYPRHPGGEEEHHRVEQWAMALPRQTFHAVRYGFINRPLSPTLFAVQRR